MGPAGERRSGNFEQLSSEIREYLGSARGEMNVVLYTDSSPTRTVNSRLYRHNRTFAERRLDGLGQTRGFVHLESQPVTQTVPKCVAIATVFNVATSQTVGILPLHARAHRLGGDGVGVPHDLVDIALLARRLADHDSACNVRAVAAVLRAEIQKQKVAALDHSR